MGGKLQYVLKRCKQAWIFFLKTIQTNRFKGYEMSYVHRNVEEIIFHWDGCSSVGKVAKCRPRGPGLVHNELRDMCIVCNTVNPWLVGL